MIDENTPTKVDGVAELYLDEIRVQIQRPSSWSGCTLISALGAVKGRQSPCRGEHRVSPAVIRSLRPTTNPPCSIDLTVHKEWHMV
jgi:hypothetical protein